MEKLLKGAMAPSTAVTYRRAVSLLAQFVQGHCPNSPVFPATTATMANFIAYLFSLNYSPSSITTYCSAIAAIHKLQSYPDPLQHFAIKKLLTGAQRIAGKKDARLPITEPILLRLATCLQGSGFPVFTQRMLKAMYTLAFYAVLRIGEITVRNQTPHDLVVQRKHVQVFQNRNKEIKAVELTLTDWKHRGNAREFRIWIPPKNRLTEICPVQSLCQYLAIRGTKPGPLFLMESGVPCTRTFFTQCLNSCLLRIGLSTAQYKTHSFRIGGATLAALAGMSEAEIQRLGRWKSSAFKKYIRVEALSSMH